MATKTTTKPKTTTKTATKTATKAKSLTAADHRSIALIEEHNRKAELTLKKREQELYSISLERRTKLEKVFEEILAICEREKMSSLEYSLLEGIILDKAIHQNLLQYKELGKVKGNDEDIVKAEQRVKDDLKAIKKKEPKEKDVKENKDAI